MAISCPRKSSGLGDIGVSSPSSAQGSISVLQRESVGQITILQREGTGEITIIPRIWTSENLFLGSQITETAVTYVSGEWINMFDSDDTTNYRIKATTEAGTDNILFDFGQIILVNNVIFVTQPQNNTGSTVTCVITIQTSTDNSNWTTEFTNSESITSGQLGTKLRQSIGIRRIRSVRFLLDITNAGFIDVQLLIFRLYASGILTQQ